jgi:hypothetical protein
VDEDAMDLDFRTNQHFTLKTNPLKRGDLDDSVFSSTNGIVEVIDDWRALDEIAISRSCLAILAREIFLRKRRFESPCHIPNFTAILACSSFPLAPAHYSRQAVKKWVVTILLAVILLALALAMHFWGAYIIKFAVDND